MATTVILGTGIIGLSTAYYLADHQPGNTIHLVDPSPRLFASASGFAGGFIAKDWFSGPTASLGALSFAEHRRLAEEHDGGREWGYTRSVSLSYEPPERRSQGGKNGDGWMVEGTSRADLVREREEAVRKGEVPEWLKREDGDQVSVVDNGDGTAIVDPLKLCHFLLEKVKSLGVHVHHPATALDITTDVRDELASVRIGYTDSSAETEIPCTRLLLSAGAWTPRVFASLFPADTGAVAIPVSSLAGHSLVVRTQKGWRAESEAWEKGSYSLYCTLEDLSPELYARKDGVIYLAGVNSSTIPLPDLATAAEPEETSMNELKGIARRLIASDDELEVVRTGLCFRPVTARGTPIITRIEDGQLGDRITTRPGQEGGVFIAAGHGPWGISLSLGTGRVLAEMMQGRGLSADVSRLGL